MCYVVTNTLEYVIEVNIEVSIVKVLLNTVLTYGPSVRRARKPIFPRGALALYKRRSHNRHRRISSSGRQTSFSWYQIVLVVSETVRSKISKIPLRKNGRNIWYNTYSISSSGRQFQDPRHYTLPIPGKGRRNSLHSPSTNILEFLLVFLSD